MLIFATQLTVGAIAQLVEQRTENPCVPGSIPGGTTRKTLQVKQISETDNVSEIFCFITPPQKETRTRAKHDLRKSSYNIIQK